MKIGDKEYEQIIVTDKKGHVLAVISDTEVIESDDANVILDEKLA